jgi:bacterial/archaeal transporter family protein
MDEGNAAPMKPWILFAIISMVFAGFTSVIAKMGLTGITGELGLTVRTAFVFLFVLVFAAIFVPPSHLGNMTAGNWFWLGLSGVTTTLSWIFYYKALKDGEVSTIALIDKGSIIVAVLCACFILKEQITLRVVFGGVLMITGLLIIAKK